ncbi:Uncharacterized protein Adt_47242 [Abeliophyllum distichum]|uniref:F-box domain-containing protein n=1 Tax=Abeliophyllum distichum TaxID=126358 RepID=A0ABD1NVW5_9LAMI
MKKLDNNKTTDMEDNFSRLPEQLLVSIFTKLANLKFLCRCSLVCKRFASTMSGIQNVSLTLPSSEASSFKSTQDKCKLFQKILCIRSEEIPGFIQSESIQKLNFIIFLQKFEKLESIYLEFTCPKNISNSPFLEWKAKCGSSRAEIESLVCLIPGSIHKITECQPDEKQENQLYFSEFLNSQIDNCLGLCWSCTECVHLLCILIKCHHSLKCATITNSEKQGILVLKDEQLILWRNSINEEGFDCELPLCLMIASLQVLNLPLSGYLMKKVCLVIIKFIELARDDYDDDDDDYDGGEEDLITWDYDEDILTWDFDEEEKLLGEALKEILSNHDKQFRIISMGSE